MSDAAVNAAIRRMGFDTQKEVCGHGFRHIASTLLCRGILPMQLKSLWGIRCGESRGYTITLNIWSSAPRWRKPGPTALTGSRLGLEWSRFDRRREFLPRLASRLIPEGENRASPTRLAPLQNLKG
jgi:hypothetical protein